MITTVQSRGQFEASFSKIMKSLPADVQKKWNGIVTWKDDRSFPEIDHEIVKQFTPVAQATYVTLLNKLSRGRV